MSQKETDPLLPLSITSDSLSNKEYLRTHGFSFFVALAFAINFSMGAGFLALPWSFLKSGLFLSLIVMILVPVPLFISVLFNLEAMSRANIVDKLIKSPLSGISNELLVVGDERYEISDLCSVFVGKWSKFIFLFLLTIYTYGCLWNYCAVFSHSMSLTFPITTSIDTSYYIYLFIYGLIVVPLTCLEVTEQIYVQVFLTFCRLVVVLVMLGTVIIGFENNPGLFDQRIEYFTSSSLTLDSNTDTSIFSHLIHFRSLHIILPVATFAFIFTHNIPVISEPVEDKRKLHWIYLLTLVICFLAYTSIGLMVSFYYGENILSACNLNWALSSTSSTPLLTQLVSIYVVIFPALDVISAFPLNAITLGNNLLVLALNHTEHVDHTKISPYLVLFFRLFASIPAFILTYYVSGDVGMITEYSGICGLFLAFIFPPLVAGYSESYFHDRGWNSKTVYSIPFLTSKFSRVFILIFGIILIINSILQTLSQSYKD